MAVILAENTRLDIDDFQFQRGADAGEKHEDEQDNGAFMEYEWAGQTRIRATALMEGGFKGAVTWIIGSPYGWLCLMSICGSVHEHLCHQHIMWHKLTLVRLVQLQGFKLEWRERRKKKTTETWTSTATPKSLANLSILTTIWFRMHSTENKP